MSTRVRLPNPMAVLVWATVFVPGHLFGWWVERAFAAFVFAVAALTILTKGAPWETRPSAQRAAIFAFAIFILYTTSYVFSVAFNGITTGERDYFELVRYLIVGTFAVYAIRHHDASVSRAFESAGVASFYWSLLVLLCFKISLPVLTPFLKGFLYEGTKTSIGSWGGQLRLSAPFENPNFLGFWVTLVIARLAFFSSSKLRFVHGAVGMLVVFFTGSRTAWAATAVVLAAAAAVYAYLGALRVRLRYALQLSVVLFVALAALAVLSEKIMANTRVRRVVVALERGGIHEESNASLRLSQARRAMQFIERSPLLGWGPSKYETMTYVDNQYLLWLLRNGIFGTLLILAAMATCVVGVLGACRGDPMAWTGAAATMGAVALTLLAGQFLENFRLLFLTGFALMAMARRKP